MLFNFNFYRSQLGLSEFRNAAKKSLSTGVLIIKTGSDIVVVLPIEKVFEDEKRLSQDFKYPITTMVKGMMEACH